MERGFDIEKQPKAVQSYIKRLEMDLAQADRELAQYLGKRDSDTVMVMGINQYQPLPSGHTIRFQLGPADWQTVDVRRDGDHLHIIGMHMIEIKPIASNTIDIKTVSF